MLHSALAAAKRPQAGAPVGIPFLLLECRTSEEVIRERLQRRVQKAGVVSDGRWEIYNGQLAEFEPPEEIGGDERVVLDRSKPVEELLRELAAVLPHEWLDAPDAVRTAAADQDPARIG